MSKARWLIVVCFVVLLAAAGAAWAWDNSKKQTIAKGISVGGVAVGGKDAIAARSEVSKRFAASSLSPVVVKDGGHRYPISASSARVSVDVDSAISKAVSKSRSGWFGQRVWRDLTGARSKEDINPQISVDNGALRWFVRRVAKHADKPAVEAHLLYGPSSLATAAGSPGRAVNQRELVGKIKDGFSAASTEPVVITAPTRVVRPHTDVKGLADRYPTVITVSRSGFKLYLWKHLKLDRTYPIAVGMAGLETPAGLYSIQDKQVNPSWHVPNSPWAGDLAGKVIPPGPDDPIKARWMGIAGGAGIHGTSSEGSLGSAASHGCVRMAVSDVIDLYDRVSVGDPVYIE